ncbi:hypothetical protein VISI1226_13778 [Vibrio sinaloensis DSM 21326]|uniref:HDOD domain-containing protein n=1 Tax=Vibrio sinaloensis DSM 21326 TaxID=945550 RepID=E8M8Q1_PHOS4|nr:HDOD domain-containing protein [Vibrio sinaloensis]EGA69596.1 hypothetical protein VISI1226_13778 [Vibrio sinaloensis DSM 21326]
MLVTNRKYNSEATALAQKISHLTYERHAKWLVSLKYILDQSDVDSTLSRQSEFCDSVILKEEERITDNQRLLLECESERVQERRQEAEDRQKVFSNVVAEVSQTAEDMIRETLLSQPAIKLLGRFPDFSYFSSVAYSPSLSFSKLNVLTTNDNQLKANFIALVNNPKFCARIGKMARDINDPQIAIGTLGMDNCKVLFPILMVKPILRWHNPLTKTIAPKLWQHMILTANVTRIRLQEANVKNPEQGILLGVLRTICHFAIVNQFPQLFEDALIEKMRFYRENNFRNEYYACAEVKPNMNILPKLLVTLEKDLTRKIVEEIEWSASTIHLKNALLDDIEERPILERSEYGQALAQGQAYSMFDNLDRSSAFVDKHKPFWFAHVQMPADALKHIREKQPGKISLESQ